MLAVSCGGNDIVGSSTVIGDYHLQSVNGSPMPVAVNANQTITQDTWTLYRAWTYLRTTKKTTAGATETTLDTGAYEITGNSVTFKSANAAIPHTVAIYSANTLTVVTQGSTAVYRKP